MSSAKTWSVVVIGADDDIVLDQCPFVPRKVEIFDATNVYRYTKTDTMSGAMCFLSEDDGTQSVIASTGDGITIGEMDAPVTIDAAIAADGNELHVVCEGY